MDVPPREIIAGQSLQITADFSASLKNVRYRDRTLRQERAADLGAVIEEQPAEPGRLQ